MLRRIIAITVLLAAIAPAALAQYWDEDWHRPVVCCDDRPGCQVLQMAMMGSFDTLDPQQLLSVRVLSAAYPKLKSVSEADVAHFIREFGVEESVVRRAYYIALASCLWADILMGEAVDEQEEEARQVLLLFLDPASAPDAERQMALIRSAMNEAVYARLASRTGLPTDFIHYLIDSENWHEPVGETVP